MPFNRTLLLLLASAVMPRLDAMADDAWPMHRYAMPANAGLPGADFSGRYLLHPADATGFVVHEDRFEYADDAGIRRLPAAQLDLVQRGNDLLPSPAGIIDSGHPGWEIAVQPGKIWRTANGLRAVLPFALLERNANCTHNGVLSWNPGRGDEPALRFQVSSETCAYFKFDLWGTTRLELQGDADYPAILDKARQRHQAAALPVLPITAIADDYPGVDASAFGAVGDMREEDMTVYGVVVDGRHYRSACRTRHGPYPYCDQLLLPSYSTAKSIVAGLAVMHLERLQPGAAGQKISQWVDACSEWGNVNVENALDMATGRYASAVEDEDEASPAHVAFLYASTHAERIGAACRMFRRREAPGQRFVYHSSDTYVVGTAVQAILEKQYGSNVDLFRDLLEKPAFAPLALSPVARQTRRSYDKTRQALTGWGMTFVADDLARIGNWLNVDNGRIAGHELFDRGLFDAAMQRDPADRGLPAYDETFRYNNGFWAHDISAYIGCSKPVWVPFMSGYGGISVVLFPNGVTYYYVSDGYKQRWREAATAINRIRSMCS